MNAVDDVTVLTGFLDEAAYFTFSHANSQLRQVVQVKRTCDEEFDVANARPRVIRNKTVPDGPRGKRVAPYKSTTKTYDVETFTNVLTRKPFMKANKSAPHFWKPLLCGVS